MIQNVRELKAHDGPRFRRWRRGMALCVGAVLVDDVVEGLYDPPES